MDLEQNLRRAFLPCEPVSNFEDRVMSRVSASARQQARGPGRSILYGTILVVAAAAAMLAVGLRDRSHAHSVAAVQTPPHTAGVDGVAQSLISPVPELPQATSAPQEEIPAVRLFTVSVQLQNLAKGAAIPAVELYFSVLLDNLRAVPGLKLIAPATDGVARSTSADYTLTVVGTGPWADNKFGSMVELIPPGGGVSGRRLVGPAPRADITPGCAGVTPCVDAASRAASTIEDLRSQIFPPDPASRSRLRSRLMDSSQNPEERLKALKALNAAGGVSADGSSAMLDAAALRGAMDLATSATDPEIRASVWRTLRGVRNADILPSLVASLRDDSSIEVRVETLATLSADFREDARGRAAIEETARSDARPMLRALAQRALTGDAAAWRQHIVSSLQDTTSPVAERIAAFAYHTYGISPGSEDDHKGVSAENRRFLDDEMIQALATVLPQAVYLPDMEFLKSNIPMDLLATGNPAGVRVILQIAKQGSEGYREDWIDGLAEASSEAGIRDAGHFEPLHFPQLNAQLRKISAEDPDPQLRQIAAEVLKAAADP